jgi:putative transposase
MLAGCPFHVTHRGNHRRETFASVEDREFYLATLRRHASRFGMEVWAYCLMPNHVHLLVRGKETRSIPVAIGNAHRLYSRALNERRAVTGHLWANRYYSTALDDLHLWAAVRYVELNPVRAGLAASPIDYAWSSAAAHAGVREDALLHPERPFPGHVGRWADWLALGLEEELAAAIRKNTESGKATGSEAFVASLRRRGEDG